VHPTYRSVERVSNTPTASPKGATFNKIRRCQTTHKTYRVSDDPTPGLHIRISLQTILAFKGGRSGASWATFSYNCTETNLVRPSDKYDVRTVITENKWDLRYKMFGDYDNQHPFESFRKCGTWKGSKYHLRFGICIIVVNYRHIPPSSVNRRILHQYVLGVGEHTYLYIAVSAYSEYLGYARVLTPLGWSSSMPDLSLVWGA